MRVLFITSNRLGDAILSTGVLAHFLSAHPGADLTVMAGAVPAQLFRAVPGLERIIPIEKTSYAMHWVRAYGEVVSKRWDLMIDLRNVGIMRLLPAKRRIFGTEASGKRHRLEDYAAMLGIETVPTPVIWLDTEAVQNAKRLIPDGGPVIALGPTTGPKRKLWRPDRYAAVASALTGDDGPLPHARLAVFAAPSEAEHAGEVLKLLPEGQRIDLIGKTDVLTAAASLGRCSAFVGVDSGLMHLAAAMDVPTLGLFGDLGVPQVYRPWGNQTAYVHRRNPGWDEIPLEGGTMDKPAAMDGITVDEVVTAAKELFVRAGIAVAPRG